MRIILVLFSSALVQLSFAAHAQRISISAKDIPLDKVFNQIETQTNYHFLYFDNILRTSNPVTIYITDKSIPEALDVIFKAQPLTYSIKGKVIIVQRKNVGDLHESKDLSIQGKVIDENGQGLSGATIKALKSNHTTATNHEGTYTISVTEDDILQVSFVGYETVSFPVRNQKIFDIKLIPQSNSLTDVVVIGYGSIKRGNVSGAISTVKGADLDASASANFAQTLQGKASGVEVIQNTGQPGAGVSIKIRSNPSFANAGVLYVLDGVPVNDNAGTPSGNNYYGTGGVDQSPLNFIDPNDIESIQFLKDASSAAIYGARAGAGVVLITTKRGKSGSPKVSYSGSHGLQNVDKLISILGTKDYMEQRNLIGQEIYMRDNMVAPYYGTVDGNSLPAYSPIYTQQQIDESPDYPNAMKAITRKGYTDQHDLSISGGTDKSKYFISINYFNQRGVVIGSGLERYNGRINLDQAISDKVKVGVSVIGSNSTTDNQLTGGVYQNGGIVISALYYPANLPLQNADGSYPVSQYYPNIPNPLSYRTTTDQTAAYRLLANTYVQWDIVKGLTAKANFSYDQSNAKRNTYLPTTFLYGATSNGSASINENTAKTSLSEYTLNYNRQLSEKQSLNVLFGTSYQITNYENLGASNQNFFSDVFNTYNLGAGQSPKPSVSSGRYTQSWASYFGRAIYTLNNKYTLQASLRRDGSSNFAENKKWGYFPSVSASWLLSEEDLVKKVPVVSYAKVRVGYGETGNSSFPGSAYRQYGTGLSANFGTGQQVTGVSLYQEANPNLTWETAAELNMGVDVGFFKDRITGSFDYYTKTIRNLISYIPNPVDWIVPGIYGNSGKTRTNGFDISLQTKNIISKNGFSWSTNLVFSHYYDYWVKRSANALATLPAYVAASGKGAPFNGMYGYVADGFFTGKYGTAPSTMPNMLPGGIIVKDIHGYDTQGHLTGPDGHITAADMTLIGSYDPKFNFGIGNTFKYKNFDLNIFLAGMKQQKFSAVQIFGSANVEATMNAYGWNTLSALKSRWTFQNTTSGMPSGLSDANYGPYQGSSTYWLKDASYLRCRNLTLGYTVPPDLIKKSHIFSNLRIYADSQNLFTITGYKDLDPELYGNNYYPFTKTYLIGLNASF